MTDFGTPVGYLMAMRRPERLLGLVVQNGNTHEAGLNEEWDAPRRFWAEPTEENKAALPEWLTRHPSPGVVGYLADEPIAWCGFGRRPDFPRTQRSSLLRPVDDEPVIALTCLLLRKDHRNEGLSSAVIGAVCDHLSETAETRIVEAYPVEPAPGRRAGADNAMTGIASAFRAAGFTEVARPRNDRPVMRYSLR